MASENLFGAIDLGAEQFTVLAARHVGSTYEIVGYAAKSAVGVSCGKITNLSRAREALAGAVREVELMAGKRINLGFVVGISGSHICGETKQAPVKVSGSVVSEADIGQAIDTLQAFPLPSDYEIIHVLEQEFEIDGHGGISSPLGMNGNLLQAKAYVVIALSNAISNLSDCVAASGASLKRVMCAGLAAGHSCSTSDERELGVATLDWGASCCDIAVFQHGVPRLLQVLDQGGVLLDRDIAKTMHISLADAKQVKCAIGSAVQVSADRSSSMKIVNTAGEEIDIEPQVLSMVIQSRVEESLEEIRGALDQWLAKERLPAGIVITGGMAKLPGLCEIATEIFNVPVRIGMPNYSGQHANEVEGPRYATAQGLLRLWQDSGLTENKPTTGFNLLVWLHNTFNRPVQKSSSTN